VKSVGNCKIFEPLSGGTRPQDEEGCDHPGGRSERKEHDAGRSNAGNDPDQPGQRKKIRIVNQMSNCEKNESCAWK
jgi:hypothetical protein